MSFVRGANGGIGVSTLIGAVFQAKATVRDRVHSTSGRGLVTANCGKLYSRNIIVNV